jgi:hypothetical protein
MAKRAGILVLGLSAFTALLGCEDAARKPDPRPPAPTTTDEPAPGKVRVDAPGVEVEVERTPPANN